MANPAGVFQQDGLVPWWNYPTQTWGINGEQGTDFGLGGFGVPVGSLTAGRVVYVGDGGYPGSSIGQIVQVQSSDGLYHYQHLQTANVQVGQTVNVGDILGTSGGCPVGAYGNGTSCTRYDQYSTGEHIEVRWSPTYNPASGVWGQNWQNPLSQFLALSGSQAQTGNSTTSSTSGTSFFTNIGQKTGLLVVAIVLVGIGVYLLWGDQIGTYIAGAKARNILIAKEDERAAQEQAQAQKKAAQEKALAEKQATKENNASNTTVRES